MADALQDVPIKLIVGLGNPGAKYDQTRHNAGQDWLAQMAHEEGIALSLEKRFFGDYGQGFIAGQKVIGRDEAREMTEALRRGSRSHRDDATRRRLSVFLFSKRREAPFRLSSQKPANSRVFCKIVS